MAPHHLLTVRRSRPETAPCNSPMEESANQEQDASLLQNTVEAMLSFPGKTGLLLNILSNSKQVRIDMPFAVKFCPELQQRLEELLGPESINVEPAAP